MSSGDKRPRGLPPITRIELADDKKRLRLIALVGCILIAIIAMVVGLTSALNTEPGWQVIEPSVSGLHCGEDFTLNYYLGAGELSATEEYKALRVLYGEATAKAYLLFHAIYTADQSYNLAYISAHPNEVITVDPALYSALAQIQTAKNRCLYLGPIYAAYEHILGCATDAEAEGFDPAKNAEQASYVGKLAEFANDPGHIDLELLENSQVRLHISSEYQSYIAENELTRLLDLGWMKNAFIVDFLAETLQNAGFSNGYLASYDGYTRNLDARGEQYSFNIFNRDGNNIDLPAVFRYKKPTAIVYLRDYPMSQQDSGQYYVYASGETVTTFIDPADGMEKNALHNLVSYSEKGGCARLALEMSAVFLQDAVTADVLNGLTESEIYSIWFADLTLCYNQKDMDLQILTTEGVTYTTAYAGK